MKWVCFQCFPSKSSNVLLLQHWQCGQNAWKTVLNIFLFKHLSQEIPEIFNNCSGTCFWLKRAQTDLNCCSTFPWGFFFFFSPLTIIHFSVSDGWAGEDSCIWGDLHLCKSADIPGDRSEEVLVCSLRIVAHKKHSRRGCASLVWWTVRADICCWNSVVSLVEQSTLYTMIERGEMKFCLCRLSLSLTIACLFASKENKDFSLIDFLGQMSYGFPCSANFLASGASWPIYLETELIKWELGWREMKEILQQNHASAAAPFGSQQF